MYPSRLSGWNFVAFQGLRYPVMGSLRERTGKLAASEPEDCTSVLALLLRRADRRAGLALLFTAALNSPARHQHWNETIRKGIEATMGKTDRCVQRIGTGRQFAQIVKIQGWN